MALDSKISNPFLTPEEAAVPQPVSPGVVRAASRPGEASRGAARTREAASPTFSAGTPLENSPRTSPNVPQFPISQAPKIPAVAPQVLAPVSRRGQYLRWVSSVFIAVLIGGALWYGWLRLKPIPQPADEIGPVTPFPEKTQIAETVPFEVLESDAEYSSENFRAGEIVFGGELAFLQSEDDVTPLTISAIRGEAFTEKAKQEVKLVVTWQTNKLSLADVEYAKGVGQNKKKMTEDDYSFNHSVIISGLDPASTYLYTIKATDRFGNVVTSEPYAVFTGAKSVSLFDLIAGAIGDVFGWAVDK